MVFVTIVLDGVGVGWQPDADAYGDQGADTLGHVLARCRPSLPNLQAAGLGNIRDLTGCSPASSPRARWGRMQERSAGKDSTTGHWELAGLTLDAPFPTYPHGFPTDVVDAFCSAAGVQRILGNRPESGTVIIDEFGPEHLATAHPIVYTSADSVFQIATHVDVVPLEELYRLCDVARQQICVGEHAVGRVIARPFAGEPGSFVRLSEKRKDYSRLPERPPLQQLLQQKGVQTLSVGKVADLFGGVGFDRTTKTHGNAHGMEVTLQEMRQAVGPTFIWTNLIDFDQEFGHRNNPEGFAMALEEFDRELPRFLEALPQDAALLITADHGNDPTYPGTDHTREYVPLLYYDGTSARPLGTRATFADHAATVADFFGLDIQFGATSFIAT
jgi:phosphopentomutase